MNTKLELAAHQEALIHAPLERKIFLEGPAGTGKTTAGVGRMLHWMAQGVRADRILLLVPQRTLAAPYYDALRHPTVAAGGQVDVATVGGLARRMIDLFWPLVVEEAGFGAPDARPTFLTLETAQYYMARIVAPLVEQEGYFESISIDRNRLYSQILDNLNKAAVVGFPHTEIAARLKAAWVGEQAHTHIYDQAQVCAERFRRYCLAHNLLDFSLQIDLFFEHLWPEPLCREHLMGQYTHLIVDNVEEDTPVAHDMVYTWLPQARAALVIFDQGAGYRSFLGADPESAHALRDLCDEQLTFTSSFVTSPAMRSFGALLREAMERPGQRRRQNVTPQSPPPNPQSPIPNHEPTIHSPKSKIQTLEVLRYASHRYHPDMLDWVADQIAALVHEEGVPPAEIVVLAPFLTDALRFSLAHRLSQRQVPSRSHRPSRALRDEPATQTLLTLASLAHPAWEIRPTRYDVAYALMHAISDLDLVRAQLLASIVYHAKQGTLASFDELNAEAQSRITYVLGGRYEALRMWLARYAEAEPAPLDHFLARLFGEILSQPGYGFHEDFDAARVAATLMESVQKFRWIARDATSARDTTSERNPDAVAAADAPRDSDAAPGTDVAGPDATPDAVSHPAWSLGQEYLAMVRSGVIAAQYVRRWRGQDEDAVLMAPAYTFLLSNRPVSVQFWLNVGGTGWWERLYQPLTHPYVLSRRWPQGEPWTDDEEMAVRRASLCRLVMGLVRRCRHAIYLGFSELGEQGYEQQGPLLRAIQRVLQSVVIPPSS